MSVLRKLIDDLLGRQISTRAELVEALNDAGSDELISHAELSMVHGVLRLFEQTVADVRIPVGKVVWMRLGDSVDDMVKEIAASGHSRYPVLDRDEEKVVGILHVKHLLRGPIFQAGYRLEPGLLRSAEKVPDSKRLDAMLRDFKKNKVHMAVVADEAGRMDGVVTLEDVLEKIVGEIRDEFDADEREAEAGLVANGGSGVWTARSDLGIEEFNRRFSASLDLRHADTLGGWFARELGEVAKVGDRLEAGGFAFTVAKADERRIIAFEVRRLGRQPDRDA